MVGIARRGERLIFAGVTTVMAGTVAGLAALLMQVTRRHGETLLELESLQSSATQAQSQGESSPLHRFGAPPGSVAMNFELPGIDGKHYTFTSLKRDRTLLIFIAPDCEQSRTLLKALTELKLDLDQPGCRIALISSGTFNENQRLAQEFGLGIPLLIQERTRCPGSTSSPARPWLSHGAELDVGDRSHSRSPGHTRGRGRDTDEPRHGAE